MTAKHTPGPWTAGEVVSSRRGEYSAEVYAAGYQHIVTVVEGTRARCLANARLIAAAPDLLRERDALKVERDALLAALRKALEWVEHVESVAWDFISEDMRGDNGAAWAIRSAIARATGGAR